MQNSSHKTTTTKKVAYAHVFIIIIKEDNNKNVMQDKNNDDKLLWTSKLACLGKPENLLILFWVKLTMGPLMRCISLAYTILVQIDYLKWNIIQTQCTRIFTLITKRIYKLLTFFGACNNKKMYEICNHKKGRTQCTKIRVNGIHHHFVCKD